MVILGYSVQTTWYILPYALSALFTLFVARQSWQKRPAKGAACLSLMLLGSSIWTLGDILLILFPFYELNILNHVILFSGVFAAVLGWFFFTATYTDHHFLLQKRQIWLSFLVPALILGLILSSNYHHLFFAQVHLENSHGLHLLKSEYGVFHDFVWLPFAYFAMFYGIIRLIYSAIRSNTFYQRQNLILIAGVTIPLLLDLATTTFKISFVTNLFISEIAPLSFGVTGVLYFWALYKRKLLDIAPLAHKVVFNTINTAIISLDQKQRIVELNPSAEKLLGSNNVQALGQSFTSIIEPLVKDERLSNLSGEIGKLSFSLGELHYELQNNVIRSSKGSYQGSVVLIYDVSDQLLIQRSLKTQLDETQRLENQLRDLSFKDPLTGVYNRRYLFEAGEQLFKQCRSDHEGLCAIMFDLDHFKHINDSYGHGVGDQVLKEMARRISKSIRATDILARYGGEEFVLLVPSIDSGLAAKIATRIHQLISSKDYVLATQTLTVTASVGVALSNAESQSLSQLLDLADHASYKAKQTGRNRVCYQALGMTSV
ncbi:MAG: diguanylate cyclase [Trueperaceae bacterium]|nr:diguanylate cyclase [Trueperaceae bacterium]